MPVLGVGVGTSGDIECYRALGGYIWKMKMVYYKVLLKTQDGLLQTIEHKFRSMGPKLVPLLATRCLYLGSIEGQMKVKGLGGTSDKTSADPQADDISCWPAVVPLLTTRCLYWAGVGASGGMGSVMGHWGVTYEKWRWSVAKVLLQMQDSLLQTIEHELRSMGTQVSTTLGHQIPLPGSTEGPYWSDGAGSTSDKTSAWHIGWWHVMLTCSSSTLDH